MFQYLRISVMDLEKRLCRILIVVLVLHNISFQVVHFTYCSPFEARWNRSISAAKCHNGYIVYNAAQSSIMALDFAILLLPAFILRHLKLSWYQKLAIAVALSFGGLYVSPLCVAHRIPS